jgi:DNA-binding NtrC family response regulator
LEKELTQDECVPSLAGLKMLDIEKIAIKQTLVLCKGNRTKVAKMLGISRKCLYNKMKLFGI